MLPLSLISVLFAAASPSLGATLARRALTQSNILDFAENIIVVQDTLPGFFVEIDVGGNEVLVQVDFQSADLFVTGDLTGSDSFGSSSSEALINYSFFSEPVTDTASILETNVSIGGRTIQQAFAFDASFTLKDLTEAFPQSPTLGVLGFGPSPLSAVRNGLKTGHSPIDTVVSTNATNPYVTIFFIGSEPSNDTLVDTAVAGFFTVGEPVPLPDFLPPINGVNAPDISNIHNQTAIPLSVDNSFPIQKISIGNVDIALNSSVSNADAGTSVGILSSVSPWVLVPEWIARAVYGSVKGAALDSETGLWHVPCGTNITLSVTIADSVVVFDPESVVITLPGTSQCVGSFKAISQPDQNWDISFGTSFLENVYLLLGYTSTDLTQPIMKLLPYSDIPGLEAYTSNFEYGDDNTTTSVTSSVQQTSSPGPSTRFTTVTVTHTPTTTVMVGTPSSSSISTPAVSSSSTSISATASASSSSSGAFAGALDVESSPTASSNDNANELKIYKITTYALAGLSGALLIALIVACVLSSRRKTSVQHSAYRNIHLEESADHSRALYGHDEESNKYSDPYQDRM